MLIELKYKKSNKTKFLYFDCCLLGSINSIEFLFFYRIIKFSFDKILQYLICYLKC
jgi:hypothetical protein